MKLYTLVQYNTLIFILNNRRSVSFYCYYGNKFGNLLENAPFDFIHKRRLARIEVCT